MATCEKGKAPKSPPVRFCEPEGPPVFRVSTKENQMRFEQATERRLGPAPAATSRGILATIVFHATRPPVGTLESVIVVLATDRLVKNVRSVKGSIR